jgi:hypothetical protein
MPLTKKDFEDTLMMLDACNGAALIPALAEIIPRIWEEARTFGKGTTWVTRHPIMLLFINKISSLQHGKEIDYDMWERAYHYCQMRTGVWTGFGPIWTAEAEYKDNDFYCQGGNANGDDQEIKA